MLRRLLLAALLCTGSAHGAELPEPILALLQAAQIEPDNAGIVVLRGPATLVSHNAQRSLQPASTMKLLTTLTALEQLGPTLRGRTELRTSAELVRGVLQGDLIVRGGADVDLNEDVLRHLLQALRNQGIRKIKGDVLLDRQLFQPARPDLGQPPFDEYPWAYYNVIPDALLANNNLLKLELRSSASKLEAVLMPELEQLSLRSEMTLNDAPCNTWEQGWRAPDVVRHGERLEVVLHGSFPKLCAKSTSVDVLDHHDYLARLLRASWRQLGGSLSGTVRELDARNKEQGEPAAASRLLAEHLSRPLPEVIRDINKQSDNTLARTVFLMLGSLQADPVLGSRPLRAEVGTKVGAEVGTEVSPMYSANTAAQAETVIRRWLQAQRIDDTGLVLENGSGLSRSERATPAQLAGVLQAGLNSRWMPEFLASLPIAATDGSMRKRLKDSPAAQRARIKTGSLKNVIAIAGYVHNAHNEPCIVVAILNDEHVANGAGRTVLDGVIDWVARSQ